MVNYISRLFLVLILISVCSAGGLAQESFVDFEEFTSTGEIIELDQQKSWINVDINSTVRINFDIKELDIKRLDTLSTPETKELRKDIEQLNQLLETGREDLEGYVNQINSFRSQLIEDSDPDLELEYRELLRKHGTLIENILIILMETMERDQLNQALDNDDPFYTELLNLLAEHIENQEERLNNKIQQAIAEKEMTLQVWCIHHSQGVEPSAVHLPHYDNLEAGQFNMVEKVSLMMTEEDMESMQESIQLYRELDGLIRNIGSRKGEFINLLSNMKDRLVMELNDIESLAIASTIEELERLEDEISNMTVSSNIKKLSTSVEELSESLDNYSRLDNLNREFVQIFSGNKMTLDNIYDILKETTDLISSLKKEIDENNLTDELDTILEEVEDQLTGELNQTIARLDIKLSNLEDSIIKLDQIMADFLVGFKGLGQRLVFSSSLADRVTENEGDFKFPEDKLNQVSLLDAPSTVLNLTRTKRQVGDHYTLHVQIKNRETRQFYKEYTFKVNKFGTSSTWLKNMNFVIREGEEVFTPTTSLSWVLHYKDRDPDNWLEQINQTIKPGLGLNSIIYTDEGSMKFGLGLTLSLFNDNLQLGGGINLQEEDSRRYYFVGCSLLDIFKNIKNQ